MGRSSQLCDRREFEQTVQKLAISTPVSTNFVYCCWDTQGYPGIRYLVDTTRAQPFTNMGMMTKYGHGQWPSWKSVCKQTTLANFGSLPVCEVRGQLISKSHQNVIPWLFLHPSNKKSEKLLIFLIFTDKLPKIQILVKNAISFGFGVVTPRQALRLTSVHGGFPMIRFPCICSYL